MIYRLLYLNSEAFPLPVSTFYLPWLRVFTLVPNLPGSYLSPNPSRVPYSSSKSPLTLRYFSGVQDTWLILCQVRINELMQHLSQVKHLWINRSVWTPPYSFKGGTRGIWAACGETALPRPSDGHIRCVVTSSLSVSLVLPPPGIPEALDNLAKHGILPLWHPRGIALDLLRLQKLWCAVFIVLFCFVLYHTLSCRHFQKMGKICHSAHYSKMYFIINSFPLLHHCS